MAPPDLERRIFFYVADVGIANNGALRPFDPLSVLQYISSIPGTSAQRRLPVPDDKSLYCWVDDLTSPQKARLATVRQSGFPNIEASGSLRPLGLNADEGLADEMHVAFFANNVVGAIYNHHGPRVSGLAKYIQRRAKHIYPSVTFANLVDPDIEQRLNKLQDVRKLHLKMEPSMAEVLKSHSKPLGDAFAASQRLLDRDAQIELVLRRKPYGKGGLGLKLLEAIRYVYSNTPVRDNADTFRIEGINDGGDKEALDLLSDDLVVTTRILKQDPQLRVLRSDRAFAAIQDAYDEVEPKLARAKRLYIQRSVPTESE